MASNSSSGDDDAEAGDGPPSPPASLLPHQSDATLLEAFRYVNSVPGKDVRGKLIESFQFWFRVEANEQLETIKDIVGDLHNASLLIDDIEDNSTLRRGNPVAHSIFGVPAVINTANYVYFLALEKVQAMNNPAAMQVFVGELLNLHRGQGHDIAWRDAIRCPTEQDYLVMVQDKTGGLFRLAVGLMQACAAKHQTTDFSGLVNNLAMYFQIRDDYINLVDEEYMTSKSFCEDFTEGKFSYPIIHCVLSDESDTRLLNILKQRTDNVDVKRYAQTLLKASGSLVYTRKKCAVLKNEIVSQIQELGGNPGLLKIIEVLDVQLEAMADNRPDTPSQKRKELRIDGT